MKLKQLFALTALALAGSAVLADEAPGTPLTRADVEQSVLAARAAGTLMPAGEDPGYPYVAPSKSTLTRAQVSAEAVAGVADGTLLKHGIDPEYPQAIPPSGVTRAEVEAEVLQARAHHELMPPGEAVNYGDPVMDTGDAVATSGQNVATFGAK